MRQLNKLSIEYLANAFSWVECHEAYVFAIFGREEVISTVDKFLAAVRVREHKRECFGAPMVVDDRVREDAIVLGARRGSARTPDFDAAMGNALRHLDQFIKPSEELKYVPDEIPEEVWGRLLLLS
jgi:hypothetical protein